LSSISSNVVVRASGLSKRYRLYDSPRHRVLDTLGLLRGSRAAVREHLALSDVSFDVTRGQKVGIIGRNGAGKSTLLRLITGATSPSSGTLKVQGETQALLQLGTGFHPDLTGRENVLAYLGHIGLTGPQSRARVADVVEFAELEEYIDQPVKTYSSGMAMRLMFSASTVIAPSLLVIDEVLGVGDAYFAKKSFDRIREICARDGTTLLLVTHDIYNAASLCDRMLWMDHGRIVIDDRPSVVIMAYEDSVRRQEERRLRLKAMSVGGSANATPARLLVEIRSADGRPLPSPLFISRLGLSLDGAVVDVAPIGTDAVGATGELVRDGSAWGEEQAHGGRTARPFLNFGSVFQKVAARFDVTGVADVGALTVLFDAWTAESSRVEVLVFDGAVERSLGVFTTTAGQWQTIQTADRPFDRSVVPAQRASAVGSGAVTLTGVRAYDASGRAAFIFEHGAPLTLRIGYRINDVNVDSPQAIVVLHRQGVEDVCRLFCGSLKLPPGRCGQIVVDVPRLAVGAGQYTISVAVTEAGYYDHQQTVFFSINPGMYDCWSRAFELQIVGGGVVASGTAVVLDASWTVRSEPAAS
jgi:homopolymeric O-antigen transport system ATP-binding protein